MKRSLGNIMIALSSFSLPESLKQKSLSNGYLGLSSYKFMFLGVTQRIDLRDYQIKQPHGVFLGITAFHSLPKI